MEEMHAIAKINMMSELNESCFEKQIQSDNKRQWFLELTTCMNEMNTVTEMFF